MTLDIPRIRAICFDVDGTLSDTDDQFVKLLEKWLRLFSYLFPKGDAQTTARRIVMALENPGTALHSLPDRLNIDHRIANLSAILSRPLKQKRETPPLPIIPGVKEMLENLQPCYPMAVVSARGQRNTMAFLDYFQITPFFRAIATGQTCPHTKPYPDPILWVAEKMSVPPTSCLLIGDTTVDIRAGRAAGAQNVGVLCGFGEEEELIRAGADLVLESTPDIVSILLDRTP